MVKKLSMNLEEDIGQDGFDIIKFFIPKTLKLQWGFDKNAKNCREILNYLQSLPSQTKIKVQVDW